jgi:hypothetical protein
MPWNSFVMYFTDISICQMYNISKATILPTVKPNTSRYSIATFIAKNIRYNEWTFLDRWTTNGVKSGAPRGLYFIWIMNT